MADKIQIRGYEFTEKQTSSDVLSRRETALIYEDGWGEFVGAIVGDGIKTVAQLRIVNSDNVQLEDWPTNDTLLLNQSKHFREEVISTPATVSFDNTDAINQGTFVSKFDIQSGGTLTFNSSFAKATDGETAMDVISTVGKYMVFGFYDEDSGKVILSIPKLTSTALPTLSTPTSLASTGQTASSLDFSATFDANTVDRVWELYSDVGLTTLVESITNQTDTVAFSSGLTASTTYYCRCKSQATGYNESAYSSTVTQATAAGATAPGAPTGLAATAGALGIIDLAWTAPASDGGSAITGYLIERESPTGNGFSTLVANTGNTNVTYQDSSLSNSTEYNYRVSAINAIGTGSASNEDDATTISAATAPGAPTGLTGTTASSTQIDLAWTAPASDGGSAITGYLIERESPTGNGFSTLVADTGNTNVTYNDTGLTASTEYNYRVSAINAVGTGIASNEDADTTSAGSDVTPPALASGDPVKILDNFPMRIRVFCDEVLSHTNTPATSDFTINNQPAGHTISSISQGSGDDFFDIILNRVYESSDTTLTLDYVLNGTASNRIKDLAGNDLAAFSGQAIVNEIGDDLGSLTGLLAEWDANHAVDSSVHGTLAVAAVVPYLINKKNPGTLDLECNTTNDRPTLQGTFGDLVLDYDGTDFMSTTTVFKQNWTEFHIFILVNIDTFLSGNCLINIGDTNTGIMLFAPANDGNVILRYGGSGTDQTEDIDNISEFVTGSDMLIEYKGDSSGVTLIVDGTEVMNNGGSSIGTVNLGSTMTGLFGARHSDSTLTSFNGSEGGIKYGAVFENVQSGADLTTIRNFLNAKKS